MRPTTETGTEIFRVGVVGIFVVLVGVCRADDRSGQPATTADTSVQASTGNGKTDVDAAPEVPLSTRQEGIAVRYRRFENTVLQLAEYLRKTDPERAELLIRAIGQSQENKIPQQMLRVGTLLSSGQFADATDRQKDLIDSLQSLLKLLQSEDRRSELEREKERLQKLVKDLNRLLGKEKDVRAATERGAPSERLTQSQQNVAKETGEVLDNVKRHDAEHAEADQDDSKDPGDSESPDDSKSSDDGKAQQDESGANKSEKGEDNSQTPDTNTPPQSGDSKTPSGQSPPSPGSPMQSPDDQQNTPGREQIEQAYQQMKQAIEELERQQRDKASDRQDDAIRNLLEAKQKLEEILRQLREEERGLLLTALEVRFRRMLAMQQVVYHETVQLSAVAEDERSAQHHERARKLSFDENQIALESDKALALLRDEGSSVAFPQAIEEIRADVGMVAKRLERGDVGALTQTLEQDIIEALEEILDALQKELKKQEDGEQQAQQFQQQQDGEPPLVDVLSELKMLRTLQVRINRRTTRLGASFDGEQAEEPDIVKQLQELSQRQARVQQATYDLLTGRNR